MSYSVLTASQRHLGRYIAFTTDCTDERKSPLTELFLIGPLPGDTVRSRRLRLRPLNPALPEELRDQIDVPRYAKETMEAMIEEDVLKWHHDHADHPLPDPVPLIQGTNGDVVQCWLRGLGRKSIGAIRSETWDDDLRSLLDQLSSLPKIVDDP